MKRTIKYVILVFTAIILLPVLIIVAIQIPYCKEKIKQQLIRNTQLNGSLSIEELEGNFYSNLALKNCTLTQHDSVLVHLPRLSVHYSLRDLLYKKIKIDSLVISNPQINLWQQNDSSWNVSSVVRPNYKSKNPKPFNLTIEASNIILRDGNINTASRSEIIPQQTQNFNLHANASYSANETTIHLYHLNFSTQKPDFVLSELRGKYTMKKNGIQIDSLQVRSRGSMIEAQSSYWQKKESSTNLKASRVDKQELALFVPTIKLLCSPALRTKITTKNDSLWAEVRLQHNKQSVKARATVASLNKWQSKKGDSPYSIHASFNNFRTSNWVDIKNLNALIEGEVRMEGANISNLKSNLNITAKLDQSEYNDIVFDTLRLEGQYHVDSIYAQLNVHSNYGKSHLLGWINQLNNTPRYKIKTNNTDVNLSPLLPSLKNTKLSGVVFAEGTGLNLKEAKARATLNLNEGIIYHVPFNTLEAKLDFDSMNMAIDYLRLNAPGGTISGTGNLNIDSLFLSSELDGHISSPEIIAPFVELPVNFDSLTTVTQISGPLKKLRIDGNYSVHNFSGYGIESSHALGEYALSLKQDSLQVHTNTNAFSVVTGPILWDTTTVDCHFHNSKLLINANVVWQDTIDAQLSTAITLGDTLLFEVSKLEAKTLLSSYYFPDTLHVSFHQDNKLEVERFRLKDHNNNEFVLAANGSISTKGNNDFKLKIKELDIAQLNTIIQFPDSIGGMFGTEISLGGTSQHPTLKGSAELHNPQYNDYTIRSLYSEFGYSKQIGTASLITEDFGKSFHADLTLPFVAHADSNGFVFSAPDSLEAALNFDSLNVSTIAKLLSMGDSITGALDGNLRMNGQISNPQFFGKLNYNDGGFVDQSLGIDYSHIESSLTFDGKQVTIDTTIVQQKNGILSLSGSIEFDSTLVTGNINSSSLKLDANNFFVTQHRNYELLIDANSFLEKEGQTPEFGGKIKVLRSDIFLPALIPDAKTDVDKDVPLLLQAMQASQDSVSEVHRLNRPNLKKEEEKTKLYKDLTGRLQIEIPRNTWIRNNDMRLELNGNLEVVKTGSFFEIFGNIDVIRGQYILYGKKLIVDESQILFQGGETLDPVLNINAEYVYRSSDKEKHYLKLIITGQTSEPEITFYLDNAEISETDGVSVLIFGATSDEIGYSGQNGMVSSKGSSLVASVITSQLNRTLGSQLNLDMIEITSTENWQSAAFVVGKYITNDIFITYQRGFGEVEDDEITPDVITAEYEINDKLFLRLESGSSKSSGIDIVLKFEEAKEKPKASKKQKKNRR